jgi:hypothetical protein
VRLFAEVIGYHTTRTEPFTMQPAESRPAYLFMSISAVPLKPVTVSANEGHPSFPKRMEGFYARRQTGIGQFLTTDQIEASGLNTVSALLTRVPGIVVTVNGSTPEAFTTLNTALFGGTRIATQEGRTAGGQRLSGSALSATSGPCPMRLFVDGKMWRYNPNGLDAIPLSEVEAIEVFRGLAEVPGEYSSDHARCGVVALWTKRST